MSALPPKADMCSATRDVRFGPIADIRAARTGMTAKCQQQEVAQQRDYSGSPAARSASPKSWTNEGTAPMLRRFVP
jgi:cytochrome c1